MPKIICLSSVDFQWMFQRPQQLMWEFSRRGWEVVYCNKTQREDLFLENRNKNLTICHNIGKLLGENYRADILWVVNPRCAHFKGAFNEKIFLYDCVDDFPLLILHHQRMIKLADLVITTSSPLLKSIGKYRKDVVLIPNGCDYDFFNQPTDQNIDFNKKNNNKIIGYIGAIAPWVDLELINHVAKTFPKDEILLIGASLGAVNIPKGNNITYLGHQKYEKIPSYLSQMDAVLIPFKKNQITRATNPIKLYEYLSLGKPVISTALPELLPFNKYVYINKNRDEFIESLSRALNEMDPLMIEKRKEVAKKNSWIERVNCIIEILNRHL